MYSEVVKDYPRLTSGDEVRIDYYLKLSSLAAAFFLAGFLAAGFFFADELFGVALGFFSVR